MEFGFNRIGLDSIAAVPHQGNAASQRVLGKLGMGLIREFELEGLPALWFSIGREEFGA